MAEDLMLDPDGLEKDRQALGEDIRSLIKRVQQQGEDIAELRNAIEELEVELVEEDEPIPSEDTQNASGEA